MKVEFVNEIPKGFSCIKGMREPYYGENNEIIGFRAAGNGEVDSTLMVVKGKEKQFEKYHKQAYGLIRGFLPGKTVAWVSQHDILPVQRKVLAEKLGDIEIVKINDTYTDYNDLIDEIRSHGATHAVLVLPLSMIALILDSRDGKGITWLRAEMVSAHEGECTETRYKETASDQHNTVMQLEHQCSKFNPETDVLIQGENGARHRRFLEFRILKGIKVKTEPFTGGE